MNLRLNKEPDWDAIANRWPSKLVSRNKVREFTGGLLSPRTMANLDSKKEGPPSHRWNNKKIFYEVDEFIIWMRRRIKDGRIQTQKRKNK